MINRRLPIQVCSYKIYSWNRMKQLSRIMISDFEIWTDQRFRWIPKRIRAFCLLQKRTRSVNKTRNKTQQSPKWNKSRNSIKTKIKLEDNNEYWESKKRSFNSKPVINHFRTEETMENWPDDNLQKARPAHPRVESEKPSETSKQRERPPFFPPVSPLLDAVDDFESTLSKSTYL